MDEIICGWPAQSIAFLRIPAISYDNGISLGLDQYTNTPVLDRVIPPMSCSEQAELVAKVPDVPVYALMSKGLR